MAEHSDSGAANPSGADHSGAGASTVLHDPGDKGLRIGSIGLLGNVILGLAAVAPAYSLAATLGFVVDSVGEKAPSMFVLASLPMLLVAFAYRELSTDTPDCGTTFTLATKAFGPWIWWIGGWGVAVSAIIVLANVSEISALYLFQFLGLDALADSLLARVLLGSFFIITMTWISIRGIVISERMQMILMFIQFAVLIVASVIALVKVGLDRAGPQAIDPEWSWLWPGGPRPVADRRGGHPVHLHLLGLGCVPGRQRGDQGSREDPGSRGPAHLPHPGRDLRPGHLRHPVVRRVRRHRHRPRERRQRRGRADHPR